MPSSPEKRFWLTVLFFAVIGPPVGLLSLLAMAVLDAAWGPLTDRLSVLTWHLQHISCYISGNEHADLLCFPTFRTREFPFNPIGLLKLDLTLFYFVVVSYVFGVLPALIAGIGIGRAGMQYGRVGFSQALVTGTGVGLVTGAVIGLMTYPPFSRPESAVCFFGVCLVATLVCWGIARCWWRG